MEFNIKLNEQEANIILSGLAELPLKVSMDVAIAFKKQCEEQIKAEEAE
jgi:hypothetical protein